MRRVCGSINQPRCDPTVKEGSVSRVRRMEARRLVLFAGFLSISLLPLGSGQDVLCLPRSGVSSVVRATVYRTGPGNNRVPDVCSTDYDSFRVEVEKMALGSMEFGEGCSLLARGQLDCRRAG